MSEMEAAAEAPVLDVTFKVERKSGTFKQIPAPEPALEAPIADTHCHLVLLEDCVRSLARAAVYNIDFICSISDILEKAEAAFGNDVEWRTAAEELLQKAGYTDVAVPHVRMTVGCHPHNASKYDDAVERRLREKLRDPRTSCLGEIGLDYHYDLSPREAQREVFARQARMVHETGLPLALHVREANADALAIMDEAGFPEAGTILHCCTMGPEDVEPWIERGCYIAFGGAITFNKLDDVRESAKLVPEDRLLTETDSPYMAPVPLRGVECSPEFTIFTAAKLAEIRGIEPGDARKEFLNALHANAVGLLDRKPTAWQLSVQ